MKKIFSTLFLTFLFSPCFAQKLKPIHPDTTFQAWKRKQETAALIKQKKMLHFLASAGKDSIFSIDLSLCNFTKMPVISDFKNIKSLNVSYNSLRTIPAKYLKSDSLQEVIFSNNRLKRIRFPKNPAITSVKLDGNRFRRIPRSLKRLKHLEMLEMENNNIKRIPRFLRKLKSLQEINLNYNAIRLNKQAVKNLSGIDQILLADNHLKQLPENIGDLKSVGKLNLAKNQFTTVPPSFDKLDRLKILIFYKNNFNKIPPEIFRLSQLIQLDFYYNNLREIPPGIGRLKHLEQLFLSFNHISALPGTMQQLTQLRYLYIHHNDLKIIPEWMNEFTHLQRVGFGYNKLFFIPDLSGIKTLKEADYQHNNLSHFPWKLAESPYYKILILRNNPFILTNEEKEKLNRLVEQKRRHGSTLIP